MEARSVLSLTTEQTHMELRQFFQYKHLKPELQPASAPFCDLAEAIYTRQACKSDAPSFRSLHAKVMTDYPSNSQSDRALARIREAEQLFFRGHTEEALHLLLEAKDCGVRSTIYRVPEEF